MQKLVTLQNHHSLYNHQLILNLYLLDKFSLIFFNKTLFFLPPPQIRTSFIF